MNPTCSRPNLTRIKAYKSAGVLIVQEFHPVLGEVAAMDKSDFIPTDSNDLAPGPERGGGQSQTRGQVNCLYCGERFADDGDRCPACGSVSHFQKQGFRLGAQKRFVRLFVALAIFCLIVAFWLPR